MRNSRLFGASLSVTQWFIFMTASAVALPIVIGHAFHLGQDEIASLMQRTFFVVGLSTMLQVALGHRFPVIDGPAGSWVSVFVMMATMAAQTGQDAREALQLLQGGMLLAGALLFVLGATGLFFKLLKLFTPLVTHTFLFVLSLQLSGVFLKGMLGLGGKEAAGVNYVGSLIAVGVFVGVVALTLKGKGWMRNYAVLFGIVVGWTLHALVGGGSDEGSSASSVIGDWISLPDLFAWGAPRINAGMAITATLFTLILVSNLIAAITSAQMTVPRPDGEKPNDYNLGSMIGGISHGLASVFSAIGVVPLPVTAAFIRMTGQKRRKPLFIACLVLTGLSLAPAIVHELAMLPTSVASAVSLATFVQMTTNSFQSLTLAANDQRKATILGIGLLIGVGFTLASASMPAGVPVAMQYLLGNGLLATTLVVMALERLWRSELAGAMPKVGLSGRRQGEREA
ncbi:purine/pyrimidine permease [Cohnella soli]|uniref:Purine/pyrimidine permease n=1 Tax=Cohnella soli TaxID=425005 RepID=A0ABW0HZ37_9BACL